jgi:hypothetical protein
LPYRSLVALDERSSNEGKRIVLELMRKGSILSTVANKASRENNISPSTLERIKKALGIIGANPTGDNQTWYWVFKDGRATEKDTF